MRSGRGTAAGLLWAAAWLAMPAQAGEATILQFGSGERASLVQSGGTGLSGSIVQVGTGQSASIVQNGSALEAEILQAGGAHTASIVQAGAGLAAGPSRASITQIGAQPQSFSIQQTVGNAPRVIRVIQQ